MRDVQQGAWEPETVPAPRPVIVGVDGSDAAIQAARWAANEAQRTAVPLFLLHACALPPASPRAQASMPAGYEHALRAFGDAWLREAAEVACREVPDLDIEHEVRLGSSRDVLTDASADAAVLVLGSRGAGKVRRLFVGSVAITVAAHARCPVVVVRSDHELADTGPVVVGVGGGPVSESALAFAFDAAETWQVPLVAVRAWPEPLAYDEWGLSSPSETEVVDAEQRQQLQRELAGWREKYPRIEVDERIMQVRHPADAVLAAAEHAQLIVVGAHGHGNLAGVLLGSTSQAILHRARCPVAIVRPHH